MIAYSSTIVEDMDSETKHARIFGAFNNALTAVKKAPKSSEAHKWLGILYGVTGLLGDTRKRILNGHKFKVDSNILSWKSVCIFYKCALQEHIDKCIELNPNDAYAYLLKGRFCYQVIPFCLIS